MINIIGNKRSIMSVIMTTGERNLILTVNASAAYKKTGSLRLRTVRKNDWAVKFKKKKRVNHKNVEYSLYVTIDQ